MEAVAILFMVVLFIAFILGAKSAPKDPKDSASGRWGMKTGRFLSGNWGGEDWGEKPRKRN